VAEPSKLTVFPILTSALAAVALVTYLCPGLASLLVYDREAILAGELWRLLTAPAVHFSSSHLLWNLGVFGAAGWIVESAGHRRLGFVCGFAAVASGIFFLWFQPGLGRYGGLSGLATGAVAYLCLCEQARRCRGRGLWICTFLIVVGKTLAEVASGAPLFPGSAGAPFRVLPGAHAMGLVGAVLAYAWPQRGLLRTTGTRPGAGVSRPSGGLTTASGRDG
jgi:rhomboid family GlyGly-CTERM serine protease